MSRPSTTPPPCTSIHSRWAATSRVRTSGTAATTDTAADTSAVRMASLTSRPPTRTGGPTSRSSPCATPMTAGASAGSIPASSTAQVRARYRAPVPGAGRPSASATARATVDLPEPAGPSTATTGFFGIVTGASPGHRVQVGGEPGVRGADGPPAPHGRRAVAGVGGDGRGHGDAVVAMALEQAGAGPAAGDDQPVRPGLDADAELGQLLGDRADPVRLLDPQ